MECLLLVDIQSDYKDVEGFDEIVESANILTEKFRSMKLPVVSLLFNKDEHIEDAIHKDLCFQDRVYIRETEDSSLGVNSLMSLLNKGIDSVYICGYPLEGSVYRLATQLSLKNDILQVYIVGDGIGFADENEGESSLAQLIDNGVYLLDTEVILDMI